MKTSLRILRRLTFLLGIFVTMGNLYAQQYFYVVIGSFEQEIHADKYVGYARSKKFDAQKMFSENKKMHYVYVLKTLNREDAILQTKRLQQQSEFKDTWVYSEPQNAITSENAGKIEEVKEPLPAVEPVSPMVPPVDSLTEATNQPEAGPGMKVKGKLFKFTVQTPEGEPISPGEVHNVDYRRGRDLATFKADKYFDIQQPAAKDPLTLVCGIFGYKEVVKTIDYNNPAATEGASQDERGVWTIPFTLQRMKKGDVSVMYHVSFYKDAVIMLPSSQLELDELVNMMKMNPNYIIKIHGHSNGNNKRKIIDLGKTKNYFTVAGSYQHEGSSKELSKLRAEAVQQYLADHGVDKNRSSVYAWGGLNMLVSENSNSAKLNDRIEIEIVEN